VVWPFDLAHLSVFFKTQTFALSLRFFASCLTWQLWPIKIWNQHPGGVQCNWSRHRTFLNSGAHLACPLADVVSLFPCRYVLVHFWAWSRILFPISFCSKLVHLFVFLDSGALFSCFWVKRHVLLGLAIWAFCMFVDLHEFFSRKLRCNIFFLWKMHHHDFCCGNVGLHECCCV